MILDLGLPAVNQLLYQQPPSSALLPKVAEAVLELHKAGWAGIPDKAVGELSAPASVSSGWAGIPVKAVQELSVPTLASSVSATDLAAAVPASASKPAPYNPLVRPAAFPAPLPAALATSAAAPSPAAMAIARSTSATTLDPFNATCSEASFLLNATPRTFTGHAGQDNAELQQYSFVIIIVLFDRNVFS